MRTYESFIFKRDRKKNLIKIHQFIDEVKNFVEKIIAKNEDWIVDLKDADGKFETSMSVATISVDAYYANLIFIMIYYHNKQEYVNFDIHKQYNDTVPTLKKLIDFFEDILKGYLLFGDMGGNIARYKIKIEDLDEVLKEITDENFDFHSTAIDYNL